MIEYLARENGIYISNSTLHDWLNKDKQKILQSVEDGRMRLRKPKHPDMEKKLIAWVREQTEDHQRAITSRDLRDKALEIMARDHPGVEFTGSNGWQWGMMRRAGLKKQRRNRLSGSNGDVPGGGHEGGRERERLREGGAERGIQHSRPEGWRSDGIRDRRVLSPLGDAAAANEAAMESRDALTRELAGGINGGVRSSVGNNAGLVMQGEGGGRTDDNGGSGDANNNDDNDIMRLMGLLNEQEGNSEEDAGGGRDGEEEDERDRGQGRNVRGRWEKDALSEDERQRVRQAVQVLNEYLSGNGHVLGSHLLHQWRQIQTRVEGAMGGSRAGQGAARKGGCSCRDVHCPLKATAWPPHA